MNFSDFFKLPPEEKRTIILDVMRKASDEQRKVMERPYYQLDHTHCLSQRGTPACGQPREWHTKCCLCELPVKNKPSAETEGGLAPNGAGASVPEPQDPEP